jgi:hypothetical protein
MKKTNKGFISNEEFMNNPEVRLVEKSFKRKYPWFVKIGIPDDLDINTYEHVIFVNIYVDLKKLKSYYNAEYSDFVEYFLTRGEYGKNVLTSDKLHFIDAIIKKFEGEGESREFNDEIRSHLRILENSDIISDDMKLPNNKVMSLDGYKIVI